MGTHLLKFDKGKLYAKLEFNENDLLYMVNLMYIYPDIKFSSAKDFFLYLSGILTEKYVLVHSSLNSDYMTAANTVLLDLFLAGRVNFIKEFANNSTTITLAMVPWNVPNSYDNRVVLSLEYRSTKIKNNPRPKINLKRKKDAVGL